MTEKENAPAITEAQSDNYAADSTAPETPRADLLAWLAILAAFALAGWLEEGAR